MQVVAGVLAPVKLHTGGMPWPVVPSWVLSKNSTALKAGNQRHQFGTCFQQPTRMGLARMAEMSHPTQKPYLLKAKAWTFDKLDIRHSLGEDLLFELVLVPTFLPSARPVVSARFFVGRLC